MADLNHQMSTPSYHVNGEYRYEDMILWSDILREAVDGVKSFRFDGDVMVASYLKTGTTWLQEITWLVMNNGDTEQARISALIERVPYLEVCNTFSGRPQVYMLQERQLPRVIKTHLPARFFTDQLREDNVKILVAVRNPKDTLVSFYHFYRALLVFKFPGSWDDFFDLFKSKGLVYGDFFDWYRSWWRHHASSKVLFVKYEDLKKCLTSEIRRIADFLQKRLTDDVIEKIAKHCSFEEMKSNQMTNYSVLEEDILNQKISPFMRKGHVGDWKNYFSASQSEFVDEMYKTLLEPVGLTLEFE